MYSRSTSPDLNYLRKTDVQLATAKCPRNEHPIHSSSMIIH